MKNQDVIFMVVLGMAIWVAGTVYYAHAGRSVLETTAQRYWAAMAFSAIFSTGLCLGILRWRSIPPVQWASAVLLLAIPGMIGEAVVLSNLGTFMPRLQAASGGKYGAFLFATYAVVLGIAETVSLLAKR